MAKAIRDREVRSKTITEDVPLVRLTLEEDEAAALLTVLRGVGGDRYNSARKHTDKVLNALQGPTAGVKPLPAAAMEGALYWRKTSEEFTSPRPLTTTNPFRL